MKMKHQKAMALSPLALGISVALSPGQAAADTLEALCGTTVIADTKFDGVSETIEVPCYIEVADGAMLTIVNSALTFEQGIKTVSNGSLAALTIQNTTIGIEGGKLDIDFDEAPVTIQDSIFFVDNIDRPTDGIDIYTDGGDITVQGSQFSIPDDGGDIDIHTDWGDITVRDSTFDLESDVNLSISTVSGYVDVKDSILSLGSDGDLSISTVSGYVDVKSNSIGFDDGDLTVTAFGLGSVNVVDNRFSGIADEVEVSTGGGAIQIVRNSNPNFKLVTNGFRVNSNGGDIAFVNNRMVVDLDVVIESEGGAIQANKNVIEGADTITVDPDGGLCEANKNDPVLFCF